MTTATATPEVVGLSPMHDTVVRFHCSLNVTDLERAIRFYSILFGRAPAKRRPDYAKFELEEPPLVLSLIPGAHGTSGTLNHIGIRLVSSAALVEVQSRLELAGIRTQREDGVECCYARQTKFWATDPDGTLWELYVFEEDIDHHGVARPPSATVDAPQGEAASKKAWVHTIMDAIPDRVPHDDATLDEVHLEGTVNARLTPEQTAGFLREVLRVLRPGGKLAVHGLSADRVCPADMPRLPGPAAIVRHVPQPAEVAAALTSAGFVGLEFDQLNASPCFVVGEVQMREMRLSARRSAAMEQTVSKAVLYRGPFEKVVDDDGQVYPRGQRVSVSQRSWDLLQAGAARDAFTYFA